MTPAKLSRVALSRQVWQAMGDLVLDNQRRREVSDEVGLSFGKVKALRRIASKPRPMGELAALLGVDPPNLTALVDGLEQAGLVERQPHPTDRRAKIVAATAAGATLAQRAEDILERPPKALSELSVDELKSLARILTQVRGDREPRY